ncbi:MAG: ComF family protein [bacterium]
MPLLTLGRYAFPTDQIVGQMKYYGIRRAAALYGDYLGRAHASSLAALQVGGLVPIPLHPTRFFSRGFNQAELLARAVSEITGLPVRTDILRRVKWRRPQTQVGYKKRSKNVRGVFVADPAGSATRLAIVDDVVTTGSTVLQARSALEDAGQTVVAVLAIAGGGG